MMEIQFENENLIVFKKNQKKVIKLKDLSPKLLAATETERNLYKISKSGYGIHWPLIDEDLSLKSIFKTEHA